MNDARKNLIGVAVIVSVASALLVVIAIRNRKNSSAAPSVVPSTAATPTPSPRLISTPTPNQFELTRENILPLLRARLAKPVTAVMLRSSPPGWYTSRFYKAMQDKGIIACDGGMCCYDCKPTLKGRQLRINDYNLNLELVIGRKVPAVAGVSRTDRTSGLVDVVLNFEASKNIGFYNDWRDAFEGIDLSSERRTVRVRLYDDGWRIEKIE